jgi:gluconate kinase
MMRIFVDNEDMAFSRSHIIPLRVIRRKSMIIEAKLVTSQLNLLKLPSQYLQISQLSPKKPNLQSQDSIPFSTVHWPCPGTHGRLQAT